METRFENLVYEHRHGEYGWHPKARIHRKIVEEPSEPDICIVCHQALPDLQYDEFLGGCICDACHNQKEIGNLKR